MSTCSLLPDGRSARAVRTLASAVTVAAAALASSACTLRVAGVPITIPDPTRAPDRTGGTVGRGGSTTPPSAVAARVLTRADRYVGVPYRWGGTSPATGFDCSGYTQYVFGHEGVELPRTARQQAVAGLGRPTRWDAAGPGDLVMFADPGEPISHVAFYVGRGRILHASSSGGGVRYDDLDTRRGTWYRERLVAVRRVTSRGPALARGLLKQLGLTDLPLDPPDGAPRPR